MSFVIAEIGQAHDGSLGILHSYIDVVSKTGVDAIKFQTHIACAESSKYEPFRINFSYVDKTRFDYWKRMEFTFEQWKEIKEHCESVNLEFLSSPFSIAAVDLLEDLGVNRYKIGSGEVTNNLLLEKIAKTKKAILLSSGMSNYAELDLAVNIFKNMGNDLTILQCTTEYPTKPETWGLNVISELKQRYDLPIGFSDHSGDVFACLAAAASGAEVFEFHVTFHKKIFGPDTKASIQIDKVPELIEGINQIERSFRNTVDKNDISKYKDIKNVFEKSLAVNRDLMEGHIIKTDDLEAKKPSGMGIQAAKYKEILGRKLNKSKSAFDFLKYDDVD